MYSLSLGTGDGIFHLRRSDDIAVALLTQTGLIEIPYTSLSVLPFTVIFYFMVRLLVLELSRCRLSASCGCGIEKGGLQSRWRNLLPVPPDSVCGFVDVKLDRASACCCCSQWTGCRHPWGCHRRIVQHFQVRLIHDACFSPLPQSSPWLFCDSCFAADS